jgi:glycosyltransferase involved in cell wall biosynthesis
MTSTADITVATPSIPPRVCNGMLAASNTSVREQTLLPAGGISVALDVDKVGAAVTRQRALDAVRTTWVAFLDDDDWLYPNHLRVLYDLVTEHHADYAYSWFDGNDPFPEHRGKQMSSDPAKAHHTTMTILVRADLAHEVGFANHPEAPPQWSGEDWLFTLNCLKLGAKFIGTGEVTWHYNVHGGNTSGMPTTW